MNTMHICILFSKSLDFEVLAVINFCESFALFLTGKKEITLITDCEALVKFADMKK